MEEWGRTVDQDVFDLDDNSKCLTSAVHDGMPVILDSDSYDMWLDPGMQEVNAVSELLKPYDSWLMRCYPVSGSTTWRMMMRSRNL